MAQSIDVSSGVRIFVDDVQLQGAEDFIYDGTTYLPVRQISNAVGKPVSWDGKTRSVYIGRHESNEPAVMLADLDYFNAGDTFKNVKSIQDNLGNTYHDAVEMNGDSFRQPWEEYKLNGAYSKIKGRAILSYFHRMATKTSWFKIYGDGKLLYTSPDFTGGVEPVDFEVDLTGVLTLKIEQSATYPAIYLVDTALYQ